jgi:1,2-diacylglycerol 3-alpha-glucosyltransferase
MRIGLFTDTYAPEINGVVTVIELMRRELIKVGHEVFIFCPGHPSRVGMHPGVYNFSSFRFKFYKGMRLAVPYNRSAFQCISSLDIIHSHDPGPIGLLALWASWIYNIPHIHTYHTRYIDYRRYLPKIIRPTRGMVKFMSRLFCNRCDSVIAPSFQMKNELIEYGITCPINAVPYGVDEDEFSREIQWDVRTAFNLVNNDLLLYAGRLGKEKNLDFLLRSFKCLVSLHPKARLIIAGDGPNRKSLELYAGKLGINSYVTFTGFLPRRDLIDLYKQALFVFASKTETQGLVVEEAMMAGSPVIAVKAMGIIDLVTPGETGILVEENEGAFAGACCKLLQNRDERKKMGKAAQRSACSRNSLKSTRLLLEIYHNCL